MVSFVFSLVSCVLLCGPCSLYLFIVYLISCIASCVLIRGSLVLVSCLLFHVYVFDVLCFLCGVSRVLFVC